MAETSLKTYTVREKLNKMDVDLIDVEITLDSAANTAGDILFLPAKIENAVAVSGGSALLHSAAAIIENAALSAGDGTDTGDIDVFITSMKTYTDFSAVNAAASAGDATMTLMQEFCGQFSITNFIDAGRVAIGSTQNIGMVCKAKSDQKDLYAWGIAQSTNDYDSGKLILRLGFIKD